MVLMQFGVFDNIPGVLKLNIEEYPDWPASYFELGKFYSDFEGKHNLALRYLEKALELSEGEMKGEVTEKINEVQNRIENNYE